MYEKNCNTFGRWSYSKNMEVKDCGGGDVFYQDYNYFYLNGQNVGKARAIWNDSPERMIFLSGNDLSSYPIESICGNMEFLANHYGLVPSINFEQMLTQIKK